MKTITILAIFAVAGVIATDPWFFDNLVGLSTAAVLIVSVIAVSWLCGAAYERERRERLLAPAFDKDGLDSSLRPVRLWERIVSVLSVSAGGALVFVIIYLEAIK